MLVDIYTHILPSQLGQAVEKIGPRGGIVKRLATVRELYDLDARFRAMDKLGEYRQVLSLGSPPVETYATPEQALELSRVGNDAMAELVRRHPDRFPAFVAGLPMNDVQASLGEIERAIETLGARGVQIFTNIKGRPLDDPEFAPIFAAMARYDLPIWLHPARSPQQVSDYSSEPRSRYEMWWCFGWPYETSVAMSRLALSGIFDRHPGLKIITHHCGGMIPFFDKRIEDGMALLGTRTSDEDYSGILPALKRPLIDYFHMFYADTALFGASRGLACGVEFFGTRNVVFASDAPFGPVASTREGVDQLPLEDGQHEAVCRGNAERLLNTKLT